MILHSFIIFGFVWQSGGGLKLYWLCHCFWGLHHFGCDCWGAASVGNFFANNLTLDGFPSNCALFRPPSASPFKIYAMLSISFGELLMLRCMYVFGTPLVIAVTIMESIDCRNQYPLWGYWSTNRSYRTSPTHFWCPPLLPNGSKSTWALLLTPNGAGWGAVVCNIKGEVLLAAISVLFQ